MGVKRGLRGIKSGLPLGECSALHFTPAVLVCVVLCCTVLHCTHRTAAYCAELYSTPQDYTEQHFAALHPLPLEKPWKPLAWGV